MSNDIWKIFPVFRFFKENTRTVTNASLQPKRDEGVPLDSSLFVMTQPTGHLFPNLRFRISFCESHAGLGGNRECRRASLSGPASIHADHCQVRGDRL